jgi:hypothetical protein
MSEHEMIERDHGNSPAIAAQTSDPRPNEFDVHVQSAPSTPTLHTRPLRPSNLLDRLSFIHTKSLQSLAVSDLRSRTKAADQKLHKEREIIERKEAEKSTELQKRRKREESHERAQRHREEREEKQAREKKVRDAYGIRGFDPNAGMIGDQSRKASDGDERGRGEHRHAHEHEPPGGLEDIRESDARLSSGQTWGIEIGRPVHHQGKGHMAGRHDNCGELYHGF